MPSNLDLRSNPWMLLLSILFACVRTSNAGATECIQLKLKFTFIFNYRLF